MANRNNGSRWYSGNGSQPPQWFKPFLRKIDHLTEMLGDSIVEQRKINTEMRKANEEQKEMNKLLLEMVAS